MCQTPENTEKPDHESGRNRAYIEIGEVIRIVNENCKCMKLHAGMLVIEKCIETQQKPFSTSLVYY